MKIKLQKGRLEISKSEAVVAFHFEDDERLLRETKAIDKASGGLISEVIQNGDFRGELYQSSLIYTKGAIPAKRILLMGLGKGVDFHIEKWRGVTSKAARILRDKGIKEFSLCPYLRDTGKISSKRSRKSSRSISSHLTKRRYPAYKRPWTRLRLFQGRFTS
jgi:leucyl aminopeptidase